MKCKNCNAELEKGKLYCGSCGAAVQIVPDYNEFEEDFVPELLENKKQTSEDDPAEDEPEQNAPSAQALDPGKKSSLSKRKKRLLMTGGIFAVLLIFLILFFAAQYRIKRSHERSYRYQYEQGMQAERDGDYQSAAEYLEKSVALNKTDTDIRYALARVYEEGGRWNAAEEEYLEIIDLDTSNLDSYRNLLEFYEKGEHTDSILNYMEGISDPEVSKIFAAYRAENPEFLTEGGEYSKALSVEISCPSDSRIYYSLDGSDPSTGGTLYQTPIELTEEGIYNIFAITENEKGIFSDVVSQTYTIEFPAPQSPKVYPESGDFVYETTIYISVPDHCTAYYRWDEQDPDVNSSVYRNPITVPEGNHILSVIYYDEETGKWGPVFKGRFTYYPQTLPEENAQEEPASDSQ